MEAPASGPVDGETVLDVTRSATGRVWRPRLDDSRIAQAIAQAAGVPEIVGRILAARGVGPETAEDFLNPSLRALLPDPSGFRDMDAACARLAAAIMNQEPVTVFGDYDVDGATSAALLARFFRAAGSDISIYVPDRMKEGYGPNAAALRSIAASGARVVITVDCGTLAYDALAAGSAAGLDLIVADHHMAEPRLPDVLAVVNPNRLDESGQCSELAAVGVVFLVVVAVNRILRDRGWYDSRPEPDLLQWLDLVALGTVCDVVPLTGLNRAFVQQGLKVTAARRNAGIVALADVAAVHETIGTYHLGFLLGPRVNAGGRIGHADFGARLLSTDDHGEAERLARDLDAWNVERRAIEALILEEALAQAEAQEDAPVIVVSDPSWHPGVVGIVASRLKDKYRRPAVVIGYGDGIGKGSARSVPGFDIGAAVIAARQAGLLINGGGHAMAAGLTIDGAKIPELSLHLADRGRAAGTETGAEDRLGIDGALAVSGATRELVEVLEQAGPYGAGNKEPRFALAEARIVRADIVGTGHVRCIFAGPAGGRVKGILFNGADGDLGKFLLGRGAAPVHVAGRLRADNWQGRQDVQFMIDDAAAA